MSKKYIFANIIFSIFAVSFTSVLFAADPNIIDFGTERGSPIDKGFVFIDGNYLSPPYILTRQGLNLLINDVEIVPTDIQITKDALFEGTLSGAWSEEAKRKFVAKINHIREQYEANLQKGCCYFFFTDGGSIVEPPHSAAYKILKIGQKIYSMETVDEKLAYIKRMNWHLKVGDQRIRRLVTNILPTPEFEARVNELQQQLLHIEDFGETVGEPIEKGFMFVNGQYLDAPYIVSRRGLGIFINGLLISKPYVWPKPAATEVTEDPNLPIWVVRQSKFEDVRNYITEKHRYLLSKYMEPEVIEKMIKHIKELPCVEKVVVVRDTSIDAYMFSGEKCCIELSSGLFSRSRKVKHDKHFIIDRLEHKRHHFENVLSQGACFFISNGGETALPASLTVKHLPNIVRIVRSSKSMQAKLQEIRDSGLSIFNSENFSDFVTSFSASSQLEQRLEKLEDQGN